MIQIECQIDDSQSQEVCLWIVSPPLFARAIHVADCPLLCFVSISTTLIFSCCNVKRDLFYYWFKMDLPQLMIFFEI